MDIQPQQMGMEENESKPEIPDFGLLPYLAIQNIYKFLDHADIKAASSTCLSWRIASKCSSSYISNTVLELYSPWNLTQFIQNYSTTVFRNFHIKGAETKLFKMFANSDISTNIHELTIEGALINNEFGEILNKFVNLKKLTIIECGFDKTSFSMNEMPNVVSLSFINIETYPESEYVILYLISVFPNLEFFKLKPLITFNLNFRSGFDEFFISLISRLPDTLKEFHSILDDSRFAGYSLFELPFKSSHLTKLTFQSYNLFNTSYLIRLIESQKNLIYLNMPNFFYSENTNIIRTLIQNLPLLEAFICKNQNHFHTSDIRSLSNFKRLRIFDISFTYSPYELIVKTEIACGIAATENRILEELHLSNRLIVYEDFVACIMNLPNLKVLNLDFSLLHISHCIIDDNILQLISNHLKNLQVLNLTNSHLITNKSLIGTDNVSIRSLKNLKSLNLSQNPNINDDTLIYGLKFINLKELTLNKCDNITENGLKALSYNCPSIQKLSLNNCKCISILMRDVIYDDFHRLNSLSIV